MDDKYIPAKIRRLVSERSDYCCEYCYSQEAYSIQSLSVEHIIPRIHGGQAVEENLAYACQGCNNHKATKTEATDPVTKTVVSLFNPRQQTWHEYFTWNEDYTEIVGLTPIGRATIKALYLNRKGCVNLRRVLREFGKHPPLEAGEEQT